ncbi:MAG: tRNA lysidine(34) synthetase TilS [bacterium]|nr:tRNA lysidine(34) synthetase TilS [bacterium]
MHELSTFHLHFGRDYPGLIGCELLVALSGGADSIALLHLLRHRKLKLQLQAAHIHHGVRGATADQDAAFCTQVCRDLDIPCHILRLDQNLATPLGREASWRANRYAKLHTLAESLSILVIATAHHKDDISEGVLMQILRGTGPRALAGIAAETPSGVIRPLLPWGRDEIRLWLSEQGLPWREDESNHDLDHLRNKVCLELLPYLEATSPAIRNHLVSLAGALAADEQFIGDQLDQRAQWIDPWHPFGGIPADTIASLPQALRTRWLHSQVARAGIGPTTRKQLAQLDDLLNRNSPRAITLAGRWRLRLWRRSLWLEPPTVPENCYSVSFDSNLETALPIPGWFVRDRSGEPDSERLAEWTWSPHAEGKITMSDPNSIGVFIAHESHLWLRRLLAKLLPRHLRATWPVFRVDDTIGWVPGVWQHPESGTHSSVLLEVVRR